MTKSNHVRMIKVDIEMPQSPSKEPVIPPAVQCFNCQSLLRVFLERMILVLLLIVVFAFLSWYIFTTIVYTKRDPDFQIVSAAVNTSAEHDRFQDYVRADWRIVISTRNPNERTPIVYKKVSVMMFHQLDAFGAWDAVAAPFRQEPRNQTTLVASSQPLSNGTKLRYEILDTILEFNVTMLVHLSYKCRTCLREGLFDLDVFCPQVKVFHASVGPGVGNSQLCSVRSKRQIH